MLLVVLIMLNMVLAIIMDVYQEIRKHSGACMTIWEHVVYVCRVIHNRDQWISCEDLLAQVSEMSTAVSVRELLMAFPDIHPCQLDALLAACKVKSQAIRRMGMNHSYNEQMVSAIHLGLNDVLRDIKNLKEQGWLANGVLVGSGTAAMSAKEILSSLAVQKHWMRRTKDSIASLRQQLQQVGLSACHQSSCDYVMDE